MEDDRFKNLMIVISLIIFYVIIGNFIMKNISEFFINRNNGRNRIY